MRPEETALVCLAALRRDDQPDAFTTLHFAADQYSVGAVLLCIADALIARDPEPDRLLRQIVDWTFAALDEEASQ
jgi:hypothetical protein